MTPTTVATSSDWLWRDWCRRCGDRLDHAAACLNCTAASMVGRLYLLTTRADDGDELGLGLRVRLPAARVVRVIARGSFRGGGPARNVLLQDVRTGERLVRPFRGLPRCRGAS